VWRSGYERFEFSRLSMRDGEEDCSSFTNTFLPVSGNITIVKKDVSSAVDWSDKSAPFV